MSSASLHILGSVGPLVRVTMLVMRSRAHHDTPHPHKPPCYRRCAHRPTALGCPATLLVYACRDPQAYYAGIYDGAAHVSSKVRFSLAQLAAPTNSSSGSEGGNPAQAAASSQASNAEQQPAAGSDLQSQGMQGTGALHDKTQEAPPAGEDAAIAEPEGEPAGGAEPGAKPEANPEAEPEPEVAATAAAAAAADGSQKSSGAVPPSAAGPQAALPPLPLPPMPPPPQPLSQEELEAAAVEKHCSVEYRERVAASVQNGSMPMVFSWGCDGISGVSSRKWEGDEVW